MQDVESTKADKYTTFCLLLVAIGIYDVNKGTRVAGLARFPDVKELLSQA